MGLSLCTLFVSPPTKLFFIIPVNKVWHTLFQKYILLSLAIGVQQMQL